MSRRSSSRRTELLKVLGALVGILASTAIVARMLVGAWDAHGLVYHLTRGFARVVGFGIEGLVVFAAFLVLTWVLLFALDDDKNVQGGLLLAAIFLVFVPSLILMNRWIDTVDFLGHPLAIGAGVVLGAIVVAPGANVPPLHGDGRYQFPMAARALYATTVVVMLLGFVERHTVYRSPVIVIQRNADPVATTTGPLGVVLEAVSVFLVIYLVGYFVRYSDVTDVAISSPDDEAVASFLGGLYGEAEYLYGARTVQGGSILNSARSARHSQPRIDRRVAFRYRPGNLLVRWREVSYENIRPVSSQDIGPLRDLAEERASLGSRLRQGFRRQLLLSAPGVVRRALRGSGGRHLDRIVRADVILLIAPVTDVLREEPANPGAADAETDPEADAELADRIRSRSYLDVYDDISEVCSRGTMPTVYVVATDAEAVLDYHRSDSITSEHFISFLRSEVLGLGQYCRVIPVDRDGEDRVGYDELLRQI